MPRDVIRPCRIASCTSEIDASTTENAGCCPGVTTCRKRSSNEKRRTKKELARKYDRSRRLGVPACRFQTQHEARNAPRQVLRGVKRGAHTALSVRHNETQPDAASRGHQPNLIGLVRGERRQLRARECDASRRARVHLTISRRCRSLTAHGECLDIRRRQHICQTLGSGRRCRRFSGHALQHSASLSRVRIDTLLQAGQTLLGGGRARCGVSELDAECPERICAEDRQCGQRHEQRGDCHSPVPQYRSRRARLRLCDRGCLPLSWSLRTYEHQRFTDDLEAILSQSCCAQLECFERLLMELPQRNPFEFEPALELMNATRRLIKKILFEIFESRVETGET